MLLLNVSLRCIWRCLFIHSTLSSSLHEKLERKVYEDEKVTQFKRWHKNLYDISMIKNSQNSIFFSIILSTQRCLTFMAWRRSLRECSFFLMICWELFKIFDRKMIVQISTVKFLSSKFNKNNFLPCFTSFLCCVISFVFSCYVVKFEDVWSTQDFG